MRIVFLGSGNVATRLSLALSRSGYSITQIYSPTIEHAHQLALTLGCQWTNHLEEIDTTADLYIFSLKDNVLTDVINRLPVNNGTWVHTAGSLPMQLFEGRAKHYGVLYPLQTFSRTREVDFSQIPLLLEASSDKTAEQLKEIAEHLSTNVRFISSEKRKYVHLAAVFACNFANHLFALGFKILEDKGIDPTILHPLIDETANKVHELHPIKGQTGPAVRNDQNVMEQQLSLLDDPELRTLYRTLSNSIYKLTSSHE